MTSEATSDATFVATRLALQAVAEHVLCAARHAATGRIGLRAAPGGPTTPPFPSDHGDRIVAIEGVDLVVRDDRGEQRAPLTTVGAAAALAGTSPGAPTHLFTPTTPLEPDAPLAIDPTAAATFAAWWLLVDGALEVLRAEHPDQEPTIVQLWPEHFDIGCQLGSVNYGGSPGDTADPLPYLYVGPWTPPEPDGGYWNRPFGAVIAATEVPDVAAAAAFLREGYRRSQALA
ncbi:hypothetical protein [Aquihabitans sp. McL0605]|uniref:hypothetical protein n=1 Tax=Aquihabitans sp. McL0605 TaxID=3415671 RepID=UPI003CEA1C49